MLAQAAPCHDVMQHFAEFVGDHNMVAHYASFDQRFLDAELDRISRCYTGEFSCSLLAARRIYQGAPNHQLSTLVNYVNIPAEGDFHRALYDSEMTGKVWMAMLSTLKCKYGLCDISFSLIQKLNKIPKKSVARYLSRVGG